MAAPPAEKLRHRDSAVEEIEQIEPYPYRHDIS